MRVMVEGLGDSQIPGPAPLLIRMVDAGWLGRKSGRGVFTSIEQWEYPGLAPGLVRFPLGWSLFST